MLLVEPMAVVTAMEMIMGLDLPRVILESDSMEVVSLIEGGEARGHQYEHILCGILRMCDAHSSLVFQHTLREANTLADFVAKTGLSLPFGTHWFEASFEECHYLLEKDKGPGAPQPSVAVLG